MFKQNPGNVSLHKHGSPAQQKTRSRYQLKAQITSPLDNRNPEASGVLAKQKIFGTNFYVLHISIPPELYIQIIVVRIYSREKIWRTFSGEVLIGCVC